MAKVQEIGPYSAYAIAVKYGYQGTEEEWVQEQEANRKAAEAAAAAAAQSAKDAAASASGAAQSGQQAVQSIKDAQTTAVQAIDTAKQQAVQAAQAEAEKAANSAGQAASSAAEAAQSATSAAAEVGKVQSAGTSAVQAVQAAQNTATEAVSDAQQTATQAVSQAQTAAVSAVQEAGTTQTSAVESAGTAAVSAVSNAKTEALSQISTAGTAQVSAVGTAGADAVEDVNDAKTAALEEIDAANAALPSPTQSDAGKVPTVKADGSAYELAGPYAPLSAAIRPTASGNPVSITDSTAWAFQGLKIYGKSTQDGEPSPENPVPIISAGDGGSVELSVTGANLLNLNDGNYNASSGFTAVVKDGIINVGKASPSNINGASILTLDFQPGNFCLSASCDFANNASVLILSLPDHKIVAKNVLTSGKRTYTAFNIPSPMFCAITISPLQVAEIEADNVAIQVEHGSVATAYAPYVSQSLTISTPNGLPGIPVDSGGNYTDASGQRRWADVIDYSNEKKYQYINEVVVDGTNVKFTADPANEYWNLPHNSAPSTVPIYKTTIPINKYFPSNVFLANDKYDFISTTPQDMAPYFETVEELNAFCVQKNTEGNPLTIMYVMDTPIETPLSEEEIAAYRALHTYDGVTVVSTVEDVAGIEVRYLADGEKYIDRKISEAITSAAATQLASYDALSDAIHEGVNEA